MPIVDLALDFEPLQHVPLVRIGADLESREAESASAPGCAAAARGGKRLVEPLGVPVGVVRLECRLAPVGAKGRLELPQDAGCRDRRQPHVPLQAVQQRGFRKVRTSHVSRVVAGLPPEEPRLGVQSGRAQLVVDLHLGVELPDEAVQSATLGGADVRRRDHADGHASFVRRPERLLQDPQTVPLDEGAEQIYAVRGRQFGAEFITEAGVLREFVISAVSERGSPGGSRRRPRPPARPAPATVAARRR